jgi:hypothetical protein
MTMFFNLTSRFNSIPIKIPNDFSLAIEKILLKFLSKFQGPKITKIILKKMTKLGESHFPTSTTTTKL